MRATKRLATVGMAGLVSLGLLGHAEAQVPYSEALDRQVEHRRKDAERRQLFPSWCYRSDDSIYMGYFPTPLVVCRPTTEQWQHVVTSTERWLAARDLESITIPNVARAFNARPPHDKGPTLRKVYENWYELVLNPERAMEKATCDALSRGEFRGTPSDLADARLRCRVRAEESAGAPEPQPRIQN